MGRAISEKQRVARKQWQKRLLDWEQSDMTQSAYCRENGLNLRNFQYWRRKYRLKKNSIVKVVIRGQAGKAPA